MVYRQRRFENNGSGHEQKIDKLKSNSSLCLFLFQSSLSLSLSVIYELCFCTARSEATYVRDLLPPVAGIAFNVPYYRILNDRAQSSNSLSVRHMVNIGQGLVGGVSIDESDKGSLEDAH